MALCYINYSQRLEFTKNNNNNNNLLPWDSFFPILTLSKGASLNSSFMQDCEDQIPKRVAVVACSWNPGRISKCSRPDSSTLCVLGQLGLDLVSKQPNQTSDKCVGRDKQKLLENPEGPSTSWPEPGLYRAKLRGGRVPAQGGGAFAYSKGTHQFHPDSAFQERLSKGQHHLVLGRAGSGWLWLRCRIS